MWVAIYNSAEPTGTVRVEEFRSRHDLDAAISEVEGEVAEDYPPGPDRPQYVGVDTGWAAFMDAPAGYEWHVNLDASPSPELVAVPIDAHAKALRIGAYLVPPAVLWEPPLSLDYRKQLSTRLERKTFFDKGELIAVEYYAVATRQPNRSLVYTGGPVVREDYVYVRDSIGLAQSRTLTITWLHNDGTAHPVTKPMPKTYNDNQSMKEGKRRRSNVLDDLEVVVAGLLLETELANHGGDVQTTIDLGRDLASTYGSELRDFVEVSRNAILTAIEADTSHPWLDNLPPSLGGSVSIRAAILATIDIWS